MILSLSLSLSHTHTHTHTLSPRQEITNEHKGKKKTHFLFPPGVGYGQAFATWAVVTYYVSLMALTVFYFFASFSSVLPWSVCGTWATELCIDKTKNVTELAETMGRNVSEFTSAAEEYFK